MTFKMVRFDLLLQRLAIINNVPVGRRRREAGVEGWPNIDIPALETKIGALETKLGELGGENREEEEWATDMGRGKMSEDTLLAHFAQFDVNQSGNVNQQSESQVDSLSRLGGLVGQMVRWTREEDWHSLAVGRDSLAVGRDALAVGRDAEEEEEGEESCLVSTWRCMSEVLEQGVTCFQRPRGFQK